MIIVSIILILALLFGCCFAGAYFIAPKYETMDSLQKIDENLYVLDYTFDYDIDELLERGVSDTADMLAYASVNVFGFEGLFKANEDGSACSTFNAQNPDGDIIFGRNFDYYKSPCILVWTHPADGYASIGTVNGNFLLYSHTVTPEKFINRLQLLLSPYACMDGMNEKGLTIAILELDNDPIQQDTDKVDLTNTCMLRAVLDKAATVPEAIEIFKTYDIRDQIGCSYHYQITDANGESVIIEYLEDGTMNYIYPELMEGGYNYQCLTNYYRSYPKDHSAQKNCFGWDRMEVMDTKLYTSAGILTEDDAMALLSKVHLDTEMDGALDRVVTVWSEVYNLQDKTVNICAGMNYETTYRFSLESPCILQ